MATEGAKRLHTLATQYLASSISWASEQTPLFYGWFWLIVLSAVIVVSLFLRRQPLAGVATALAISGLAYILPYYFIVPASDFRYIYWSIIAGSMGVVILAGIMVQRMFVRSGNFWMTKAIPDKT